MTWQVGTTPAKVTGGTAVFTDPAGALVGRLTRTSGTLPAGTGDTESYPFIPVDCGFKVQKILSFDPSTIPAAEMSLTCSHCGTSGGGGGGGGGD
jgi:hypothetical protein